MTRARVTMPRARTEDLVVEDLPDETLVYDLTRDRAHCLNPTAALVWRHCDGATTVADVSRLLATELNVPTREAFVWAALERLDKVRLLAEPVRVPASAAGYTRREAVRALGLTAALPAIVSIVAPRAAHAQSCATSCSGQPNCTPCRNGQGRNCNRRCCAGACRNVNQARSRCGC